MIVVLVLTLAAFALCVEMVVSHHKYTEILLKLRLDEAVQPPNGWLYKIVHPFVVMARGITHN